MGRISRRELRSETAMLEYISSANPAPGPTPNKEITLSSSLSTIFRGRLCRILLENRSSHTYDEMPFNKMPFN